MSLICSHISKYRSSLNKVFFNIFSLKKKNEKPKERFPAAVLYLPQKNKIKKEQLHQYSLVIGMRKCFLILQYMH